jgi:ABC-type transport system substrate-binding protein
MKRPAWRCLLAAVLLAGCSLATAAEQKVLKVAFRSTETGFDPQRTEDRYSTGIQENIFESLLTYDYLARPVKLVGLSAEAVPEGEEGGTRFTFHIKPGIYFAPDPVFKGKKRELVARDMEYAIKRFRDPSERSPYSWLFENNIVGFDEFVAAAKKSGKYDYDASIPGVQVLDKYTLSFKLKAPDYNFLYFFAMPNVVPVAREAIEFYAPDNMGHPVGTGPFVLKEWVRRSKIVLERNPNHRGYFLDTRYANPDDPWDQAAIKALAGKRLPLLDRIEVYPIEEQQPRYLAFMNFEHDLLEETPFTYIQQLLPNGKLSPTLAKRGVSVYRSDEPDMTYTAMNMDDPIIGGYRPENVALRRAMVMAEDRGQEIAIIRRGQATAAQSPIPPGVVGYDPDFYAPEQEYDPARAKALLDMYGYLDRNGDGWREMPDGRPITLHYKYRSGEQESRQVAELWVKSLAAIGLRATTQAQQFPDLLKDRKTGKYQFSEVQWIADYPDGQNFLQLLYGPNIGVSNDARFRLPAFDAAYRAAAQLPDGPERNLKYHEMQRLLVAYAPWRFHVHRKFSHFIYPWVLGYKRHPIYATAFRYLDLDVAMRKAAVGK